MNSPQAYIRQGRAANALRALKITRGFTVHAEGSVLIEFGQTRVLCNCSVLDKVPPGLGHGRIRHAAPLHPYPQRP